MAGLLSTVDGYRLWAAAYDDPGNPMIDVEEPVVRRIVDGPRLAGPWTPPAAPVGTPGI
jgi:hypothetical protein